MCKDECKLSIQYLLHRRTQVQSALSRAKTEMVTAQTKLERLKQAKVAMNQLISEISRVHQKLQSLPISSEDWQGTTEKDYRSGPKSNIETSVSNYVDHLNDASYQIDQEIQRLMIQIDSYNSQISSYSSTVALLNHEIRNLRSE